MALFPTNSPIFAVLRHCPGLSGAARLCHTPIAGHHPEQPSAADARNDWNIFVDGNTPSQHGLPAAELGRRQADCAVFDVD